MQGDLGASAEIGQNLQGTGAYMEEDGEGNPGRVKNLEAWESPLCSGSSEPWIWLGVKLTGQGGEAEVGLGFSLRFKRRVCV